MKKETIYQEITLDAIAEASMNQPSLCEELAADHIVSVDIEVAVEREVPTCEGNLDYPCSATTCGHNQPFLVRERMRLSAARDLSGAFRILGGNE